MFNTQKIYELLPAIYRLRDSEQGEPLKEILSVIASQAELLEENLEQLYDDQFIETCADWVVPYIGDLIGYRAIYGVAPAVSSPRAEVANTIACRRRKGTASMLEQLAQDVTGRDARVVEFFQLLATTQAMNHLRPDNLSLVSVTHQEPLENLQTPFNTMAHLADVRRIGSGRGLYNIPNIGIFLWRLRAYPLTESPAVKLNDDADDQRYLFHPLGIDTPLFTRPEREQQISHLAGRMNVPMKISRRMLCQYLDDCYGREKSFSIIRDGQQIPRAQIVVCNLADAGDGGAWAHKAPEGDPASGTAAGVAVDPVLGRIDFPDSLKPSSSVTVTFHYGFTMDIGGGEYERAATFAIQPFPPELPIRVPDNYSTIAEALEEASRRCSHGIKRVAIEITDNGRYEEAVSTTLAAGQSVELRAANGRRPTIVLSEDWHIDSEEESRLWLNGLVICGGSLKVDGRMKYLSLDHCTLVPGLLPDRDGTPLAPDSASLVVATETNITVEIRRCITGGLQVNHGEVFLENVLLDATDPTRTAYAASDGTEAGAVVTIVNVTIIGKVHTRELVLATNAIFYSQLTSEDTWPAAVWCEKQQSGCVRFSFLPPDSIVPHRYQCQPDLEIEKQTARAAEEARHMLSRAEYEAIAERVRSTLVPHFTTLQYGTSGYGQLRTSCPQQIRTGAEDESEMGVFHDLFQPQQQASLLARLDEYLRLGLEAGIFYVT